MFGVLGEIIFRAIESPESFDSRRSFTYAEHQVVEDRPRLQWLAPELEEITLELMFHASFTRPLAQLQALAAAAEDHQARALVFGNGLHRGYFVVTSLQETHRQLAQDGGLIALALRVTLKEWAREVELDPGAPPRPKSPPLGIAPSPITTILPPPAASALAPTYSPPKYTAPGVSSLVKNPSSSGAGGPSQAAADVPAKQIVRSAP